MNLPMPDAQTPVARAALGEMPETRTDAAKPRGGDPVKELSDAAKRRAPPKTARWPRQAVDGEGEGLVGNFGSFAMTRIASCQCRGFRVVVEAEPDIVGICHCQICQRRTGVPLTCNAYFPKSEVRLEGEHRIYTRDCPEDANCTTTSARPAARRSAGLSIYVQISLALRLGASTTGISRPRRRRSGRKRCALGQHCQRAFSISRVLDRFRARAKRFPTPTR